MRVSIAQLNPTIGDFEGNRDKILDALESAREEQADLVVFPELAVCGYPPEDLLNSPGFVEAGLKVLDDIVAASEGLRVIVGVPRTGPGERGLYNSAAVISNQILLGFHDKVLLPTYDVFDEARYFDAGDAVNIWDMGGLRVAVTICEDIWAHRPDMAPIPYRNDPIKHLSGQPCDVLVNLSASPYHLSKGRSRIQLLEAISDSLQVPIVWCNQVGATDGLIFDGGSTVLSASGKQLAGDTSFEEVVLIVDTDGEPLEQAERNPMAEMRQALVMGIRDYFDKQGFDKACIGLSGGIDSALVACLAVEALGARRVVGVNMPSRYSSDGSKGDSAELADNLGIRLLEIPIESPFSSFLTLLEPFFEGKEQDATEENIQARIRGLILMGLSNKHGYLVLSTGNKSELAMGYATLYGDMCGGLAVISDVTKGLVYQLARHINESVDVIPEAILTKAPSAELREGQKDTDSLPDYSVVDAVLERYVEQHQSVEQIVSETGHPHEVVQELVHKIYRNEYKRRQAPPGLRVTSKAFTLGRRFPIVQKWG